MNTYETKIEAKRERYAERARKTKEQANALYKSGTKALQAIPFGQPIIIGHHSERADRAYRGRAVGQIDRSFELSKKAEHYESKLEEEIIQSINV
jgi:hypothetical protein